MAYNLRTLGRKVIDFDPVEKASAATTKVRVAGRFVRHLPSEYKSARQERKEAELVAAHAEAVEQAMELLEESGFAVVEADAVEVNA